MAIIDSIECAVQAHRKSAIADLELTRSYLCQVSRHEQIEDASVSSLMLFLTNCEVIYYFVEMNISILLYCN